MPQFALIPILLALLAWAMPAFAQTTTQPPPDTLWLTNGEVILAKNVRPERRTLYYQWATDDQTQREVRFSKVLGIRKSNGSCEVTKGKYRLFCASPSDRFRAGERLVQTSTPTSSLAFLLMYSTSFYAGITLGSLVDGSRFNSGDGNSLTSLLLIASPAIPILLFGAKKPAPVNSALLRRYPMLYEPYYRAGFDSVERPNKRMLLTGGIMGLALGGFLGLL